MGGRRANGQGTVYKEKNHYVGQYWYEGKRKIVRIRNVKNKAEAYKVLNQITADIYKGTYIDKSSETIKGILEDLLEARSKTDLSESTLLSNQYTAKIICNMRIADMPIQKIIDKQINECLYKLTSKYSDSYIEKIFMQLSNVFDIAVERELIRRNLLKTKLVIKPKSEKESKKVEALTLENHKKFMRELAKGYDKYTDILYILIETGMRVGEVLALDRQSIDLANKTIRIDKTLTKDKNGKVKLVHKTKTSAGMRTIPISDLLVKVLSKYNLKLGYLFLKPDGSFINQSTINSHVKKVCKNAGIDPTVYTFTRNVPNKNKKKVINLNTSNIHTHMLRHSYATRCIEAGIKPVVLQKLLGHSDVRITLNTYTSVFDQFQESEFDKVSNYLAKMNIH